MDIEKIALDLALRQRIGQGLRTKSALDLSSIQPFIDTVKNNPTLSAGLAGAGLGGLYGAATGDEDDRWQRGLTGALAGGALGTGAMMAGRSIGGLFGGLGSPDPANALTPEGQQNAVDVAKRISELQSSGPLDLAGDFAANIAGNHPLLTGVASLDAASNILGSAAVGLDKNYASKNPNMYRKNIAAALSGKDSVGELAKRFGDADLAALKRLYSDDSLLQKAVDALHSGSPITVDIPNPKYDPKEVIKTPAAANSILDKPTITHQLDHDTFRRFGRDRIQRGGTTAINTLSDLARGPIGKLDAFTSQWPWLHDKKVQVGQGLSSVGQRISDVTPDFIKNLGRSGASRVGSLMEKDIIGYSPTLRNRLGARGLLYLGVPLLSMLYSNIAQRGRAAKELSRLESQYSQ